MAKKSLPTIPTLAFNSPYWELVFLGKLTLGEYAVKTRSNGAYSHRGLVLCYTGLKTANGPIRAYGIDTAAVAGMVTVSDIVPSGVVGCAMVVDVRELTTNEKVSLFKGYNNLRDNKYDSADPDLIYAMDFGYMMKPVFRFPKPFVPPVQHMYGPIGKIPLYPEIERQLPKWAQQQLVVAA